MADQDLTSRQEARDLATTAAAAFAIFKEFTQEQIDSIITSMAAAGLRESNRLARMAVEETGYGKIKDKDIKNRFICEDLHKHISSLKTVGIVRESGSILEIAEPVGVVAGIIPSTNPTSTVFYKCMIALKARNSIVISPHPSARRCAIEAAKVMSDAAVAAGAPEGVIGCMQSPSIEGSQELMSHKNIAVILATGGPAIVKAAYSSGKPAYGVGPGNVPVYLDRSADVPKAVRDVVAGKTFDYGTVCASEQALIVDAPVRERVIEELLRNGGYFLNQEEIRKITSIILTPSGSINPDLVGRSPQIIARLAGFEVPENIELLVAPLEEVGHMIPLSREKLSPILAFYIVDGWQAGCELCKKILALGGMGHTLGIHASNRDVIMQFGLQKPAHRIIVNSPTTHGAIGYTTDLTPSLTLGCGAVGNNITSDNIGPLHLINIKRIAFETKPLSHIVQPPTGESASPSREVAPPIKPLGPALTDQIRAFLESKKVLRTKCPCPAPSDVPPRPAAVAPHAMLARTPDQQQPKPVEFVCEDDVRKAADRGEKIVIGPKTIVTPAARDLGNEKNVFA